MGRGNCLTATTDSYCGIFFQSQLRATAGIVVKVKCMIVLCNICLLILHYTWWSRACLNGTHFVVWALEENALNVQRCNLSCLVHFRSSHPSSTNRRKEIMRFSTERRLQFRLIQNKKPSQEIWQITLQEPTGISRKRSTEDEGGELRCSSSISLALKDTLLHTFAYETCASIHTCLR